MLIFWPFLFSLMFYSFTILCRVNLDFRIGNKFHILYTGTGTIYNRFRENVVRVQLKLKLIAQNIQADFSLSN